MKKNEAPFACKVRINHPLFTSRMMWMTEEKAVEMSDAKCIDKNNPVKIWITKHSPNNDPKFHMYEILDGDGRSTTALLASLNRG